MAFAEQVAGGLPEKEAAVALFYAVRDRLRYSPWRVGLRPEDYLASEVLLREPREGHCIDKAMLLAALCRARGIAARLHFWDVRNHLGTADFERRLGTDRLVFHGYTELWLGGRWVAATPAFNAELCARLGVAPLEFDGEHDCVFQAYDREAGRFMERLEDRGAFATIPFEAMIAAWKVYYPVVIEGRWVERG